MTDGQEYKNIIEKINSLLNEEFLNLENESNMILNKISRKNAN